MILKKATVVSLEEVKSSIYKIKLEIPEISRNCKPGQFVNVKVSETDFPLLRRPFSICDAEDDFIYLLFNIYGQGTNLIAHKKRGESLDVLGPLGNGFTIEDDNTKFAIFVAGGIGIAPFPFLDRVFADKQKYLFLGAKSEKDIIEIEISHKGDAYHNTLIATEDGSLGKRGNVIDLLKDNLDFLNKIKAENGKNSIKFYGCGPNGMLRGLSEFCSVYDFECEISTEAAMACGFGICQGCPVESKTDDSFKLVCKDGPVFNINDIKI